MDSVYNEAFQWLMIFLLLFYAVVVNLDLRTANTNLQLTNSILKSLKPEDFNLTNDPKV